MLESAEGVLGLLVAAEDLSGESEAVEDGRAFLVELRQVAGRLLQAVEYRHLSLPVELNELFVVPLFHDAGHDLGIEACLTRIDVRANGAGELGLQNGPSLLNESFESFPPSVDLAAFSRHYFKAQEVRDEVGFARV
jgi:hypothetical protein